MGDAAYEWVARRALVLKDIEVARTWFEAFPSVIGTLREVDVNAQGTWRPFDVARVPMDTVVQLCHLVHLRGAEGELWLDTGRRTGTATVMARTGREGWTADGLRAIHEALGADASVLRRAAPAASSPRLFGSGLWERGDDGAGPPPDGGWVGRARERSVLPSR